MLREKRKNTNIGVGTGVLLQLAGFFFAQIGGTAAGVGLVLILISIPVFIWGCMNYAEGKGHSKWIGLVGLAGIVGLIVLIILPDQDRDGSVPRSQRLKFIGLISVVAGFGLAVFGLWLHDLGEDVALERRLYPWPAICMTVGACLVVGSLLFMVGNSRR